MREIRTGPKHYQTTKIPTGGMRHVAIANLDNKYQINKAKVKNCPFQPKSNEFK